MSGSLGDICIDGQHSGEDVAHTRGVEDTVVSEAQTAPHVPEPEAPPHSTAEAGGAPALPDDEGDPLKAPEHTTAEPVFQAGENAAWDDGLIARRARPETEPPLPTSASTADEEPAPPFVAPPSDGATEAKGEDAGSQSDDPWESVAVREAVSACRTVTGTGTARPTITAGQALRSRPMLQMTTWTEDTPAQMRQLLETDLVRALETRVEERKTAEASAPAPSAEDADTEKADEAASSPSDASQAAHRIADAGTVTDSPQPSDAEEISSEELARSIAAFEPPPGSRGTRGRDDARTAGGEHGLANRLLALRELVGLSRTRLEPETLTEAVRVLDEAAARGRLSQGHTTVALAGPTGCGKSSLFNALAGAQLSEVGVRRPTTPAPVACVWEASQRGNDADGLLERLGVPQRARRRVRLRDSRHRELGGLVVVDLPDHDSLAPAHREQADRLLGLVDAIIWVVDPEKYADAVLHERYLRPLAGHAEVTYVVLNQADRLPADTTGEVLEDLRRLLDEDGMALGEHGDPGAQVLALSALTGQGVGELRDSLRELVDHRQAAARRLAADIDHVVAGLRPACVGEKGTRPAGLTGEVRECFEERLGVAVGATASGQNAERSWLRQAELACGTSWAGLIRWQMSRAGARRGEKAGGWAAEDERASEREGVPTLSGAGLYAEGGGTGAGPSAPAGAAEASPSPERRAAVRTRDTEHTGRPVVEQAVRGLVEDVTRGLPPAWARAVRQAALKGGEKLPSALDRAVAGAGLPVRPARPNWWTAAAVGQAVLLACQLIGLCWLLGGFLVGGMGAERWLAFGLLVGGALGGPLLAWGCRVAARGPARAYGQDQETRLRRLAVDCGRSQVLEPVASELLRYSEVRSHYVTAAAGADGRMMR